MQSEITSKPASKNIATELSYPSRENARFPNELERAMEQFASLPMWFTLPILFVASFAVGAIVSFLI